MANKLIISLMFPCPSILQVLTEKLGSADSKLSASVEDKKSDPASYPEPINDLLSSKCVHSLLSS
jgi:hypothetical protein